MQHEKWLKEAITLAKENEKQAGRPFGAIIVKDGEVIARGMNEVLASNDPTKHAEIEAIRQACQRLETTNLEACSMYASTEPCSMCLSAIYQTNMESVYFATEKNDAQTYIYDQLALPHNERHIPFTQIKEI